MKEKYNANAYCTFQSTSSKEEHVIQFEQFTSFPFEEAIPVVGS